MMGDHVADEILVRITRHAVWHPFLHALHGFAITLLAPPFLPGVVAPRAPVLIPPSFVVREEPSYPARARRAGAEGRVVVRVAISAEGTVTALTVQESSGSALLDEAALSAARASRFSPASRDGVAEPSEAVAAYRFELR